MSERTRSAKGLKVKEEENLREERENKRIEDVEKEVEELKRVVTEMRENTDNGFEQVLELLREVKNNKKVEESRDSDIDSFHSANPVQSSTTNETNLFPTSSRSPLQIFSQ